MGAAMRPQSEEDRKGHDRNEKPADRRKTKGTQQTTGKRNAGMMQPGKVTGAIRIA
jgi:hypothetical protein